jgi:SAM-dependent methyltransferase
MDREELRAYLVREAAKPFQGWDFSDISGRMISTFLPWDYKAVIDSYRKPEDLLLDMGTGGGEFLLTLGHPPERTVVTERYRPNLALCRERLEPLGITVKEVSDDNLLPFDDGVFDLVINRHEAFRPDEVFRVLKKGGLFMTQQVGGSNNLNICQMLTGITEARQPDRDLDHCVQDMKEIGFAVFHEDEVFLPVIFKDLGALVYYAKNVVWEFPEFSVDTCFDNLCGLDELIRKQGYIEGTEHRFIVVGKKLQK